MHLRLKINSSLEELAWAQERDAVLPRLHRSCRPVPINGVAIFFRSGRLGGTY